jgi:NTP pyrophosphatase (non-canonical NTP hydrolase)
MKKLLHSNLSGVENTSDLNYVFSLIRKASNSIERTALIKKALKLNEEVGELSAEVLREDGYKDSTYTKEEIRRRIIEEAVDSLVMIGDILNDVKATDSEIIDCTEDAVTKWLTKLDEKKNKV